MKLLFLSILFVFSSNVFAKTKVLFTLDEDPKELPNLYMISDYKRPSNRRLIERHISQYVNSEDLIAYINKEGELFVITDFSSFSKTMVADKVSNIRISGSSLFYTRMVDLKTKSLNVVYDLKNINKFEVLPNYLNYSLDEN